MSVLEELLANVESGAEISPTKYARLLMHDVSEIKRQASLNQFRAAHEPSTVLVQKYLRDALRVIAMVLAREPDPARALFWFRNGPIAEFSYKTSEMLVSEGRASELSS